MMMMVAAAWKVSTFVALFAVGATFVEGKDFFRCCTPKTWTAHVRTLEASVMQGTNTFRETWSVMHYDRDNQTIAYTDMTIDDSPTNDIRVVLDYRNSAIYVITDNGDCGRYDLTQDFQPICTPHNVSFVSFAVAPVLSPMSGVFANTVYYQHETVTGQMTVLVGNCALVAEVTYNTPAEGENVVDNVQYLNQTLTVDPAVFQIPPDCAYHAAGTGLVLEHLGYLPSAVAKLVG